MLTTAIASLMSPIGVAAQAETDRGTRVDDVVMAVGEGRLIASDRGRTGLRDVPAPGLARRRALAMFILGPDLGSPLPGSATAGLDLAARPATPRRRCASAVVRRDGGHCVWGL